MLRSFRTLLQQYPKPIESTNEWFKNKRQFHRTLTLIALVPLSITVFSAFYYRFAYSVFGKERSDVRFWIAIHQVGCFSVVVVVLFEILSHFFSLSIQNRDRFGE
jgi:hypothetical protein